MFSSISLFSFIISSFFSSSLNIIFIKLFSFIFDFSFNSVLYKFLIYDFEKKFFSNFSSENIIEEIFPLKFEKKIIFLIEFISLFISKEKF